MKTRTKESIDGKEKLLELYSSICGDSLSENDNLFEKGFDSLMIAQATGEAIETFSDERNINFYELLEYSLKHPFIKSIHEKYFCEAVKRDGFSYDETYNSEQDKIAYTDNKDKENKTNIIVYNDVKKYSDLIQEITQFINVEIVSETELNKVDSDVNFVIGFRAACKDVIKFATKSVLNNMTLNRIILVDPDKDCEKEVYLGDTTIICNEQNEYNFSGLLNKKIKTYKDDIKRVIVETIKDE